MRLCKKMVLSCILFLYAGHFSSLVYCQADDRKVSHFTFSLSIPMVNNYCVKVPDSTMNNTSFLGISAALGYYYNDRNYIGIKFGATISNEIPFPLGVDRFGSYEKYYSEFVSLSKNHIVSRFLNNRLQYSLGVNFTRYHTYFIYDHDAEHDEFHKNTYGFTAGLQYHLLKHWEAGLNINSSVFNGSSHKLEYNHIAFADFIFRFGKKGDKK